MNGFVKKPQGHTMLHDDDLGPRAPLGGEIAAVWRGDPVGGRGQGTRLRSDWMAVERERGISVSSAVMSFEHEGSP
jgi:hypothetical protein